MDNNSVDCSVEIVQKYIKKYDNIFLYIEVRQGANYARNLGTEKSEGAWINYLDADDSLCSQKIAKQVKAISLLEKKIIHNFFVPICIFVW